MCSCYRLAHTAKSEDLHGDTTLKELRRQYHCAAYNTLVAIVSCTQKDVKFYTGFLFTENPLKVLSILDFPDPITILLKHHFVCFTE